MSRLFFYGSLRDRRLAEIVIGRRLEPEALQPARARDHAVLRHAAEAYPVIVPSSDEVAEGVLVCDIGPNDLARLSFFEEEEYALQPIEVETEAGLVAAMHYAPTDKPPVSDELWDFAQWQERDRATAIAAAQELMQNHGRVPVAEIDTVWPGIMNRARARARAAAEPEPRPGGLRTPFDQTDVTATGQRLAYSGYLAVVEQRFRHRLFEGGWSGEMARATVAWGDAVTVIPYDPVRDRVLLIEQFRPGAFARGDRSPWCVEVVAGRIDGDESAEATARREALEEADLEIGRIRETGSYYTSPGLSAELITGFIGEADLVHLGDRGSHGLDGEQEDIRVVVLGFAEAMAAAGRGEINTGPGLVALLTLAAHRDEIRAAWAPVPGGADTAPG